MQLKIGVHSKKSKAMRLWSVHPSYLDVKGLSGLWREGLLCQKVLFNAAQKGYSNHPQTKRFKSSTNPQVLIAHYLFAVYLEASNRGYKFDSTRVQYCDQFHCHYKTESSQESSMEQIQEHVHIRIPVNSKQVHYEMVHLMKKLQVRNPSQFEKLKQEIDYNEETGLLALEKVQLHPLFEMVEGEIEDWEVTEEKREASKKRKKSETDTTTAPKKRKSK